MTADWEKCVAVRHNISGYCIEWTCRQTIWIYCLTTYCRSISVEPLPLLIRSWTDVATGVWNCFPSLLLSAGDVTCSAIGNPPLPVSSLLHVPRIYASHQIWMKPRAVPVQLYVRQCRRSIVHRYRLKTADHLACRQHNWQARCRAIGVWDFFSCPAISGTMRMSEDIKSTSRKIELVKLHIIK